MRLFMESVANAVLVDANIWIAYFDKTDSLYNKAQSVIDSKANNVLLLTDYVIQEVITIFLYKKQHNLIPELMKTIKEENVEIITVESIFLKSLLQFIEDCHYRPKLSLADWSLLFLTEELGIPLLTFDRQLATT